MRRLILLAVISATVVQAQRPLSFDSLSERQTLNGFRIAAVYLNDSNVAMGARFAHLRSGFTLDLIGPEKQFAAWEEYLKSIEGPATKVHRLYPRDFWLH